MLLFSAVRLTGNPFEGWPGFFEMEIGGLRALEINHGEFDPGSERTLAARLKHASRAARGVLAHPLERRTGE